MLVTVLLTAQRADVLRQLRKLSSSLSVHSSNSEAITRHLIELPSELEGRCVPGDIQCSVVVYVCVLIAVLDDVSRDVAFWLCPLHSHINTEVMADLWATGFGRQTY